MRRLVSCLALAVAAACVGGGSGDFTYGGPPSSPVEDSDWTLLASPAEITIFPHDGSTVALKLSRLGLRNVVVEAEGYPRSRLEIGDGSMGEWMAFDWLDDAPRGDYELRLVAVSPSSQKTARTVVHVHQVGDRADVDPSFGTDGIALDPFAGLSGRRTQLDRLLPLPDGGLLIAGATLDQESSFVFLGRLDASGRPQASFGTEGFVRVQVESPPSADSTAYPGGVEVDALGRVLVPAQRFGDAPGSMRLMRYLPNGSLDDSFGTKGTAMINHLVASIAVEPDGKILLFGTGERESVSYGAVVSRHLDSGALDTTYGEGGWFVHEPTMSPGRIHVASDGRAIFALCDNGCKLVRLDPNGQLDPGFGEGGGLALGNLGRLSQILPNGEFSFVSTNFRVPGADRGPYDITFARARANGVIDSEFGLGGTRTSEVNFDPMWITSAYGVTYAVGPHGITGLSRESKRWAATRFSSEGELDATFGRRGVSFAAFRTNGENLMATYPSVATIQTDGKLVVGAQNASSMFFIRYR